ncbi:alpha/beta hydrolase [Enterococcus faecium]|nr:alpha/beta hydrolase [Enterococcus faecium]
MKIKKEMIDPELYRKGKILDLLPMRTEKDFRRNEKLGRRVSQGKKSEKILCQDLEIIKRDGKKLRICVYSPLKQTEEKIPGILWTHGGGFACGLPESEIAVYEQLIEWSPCVIVSPDYRLSVEAPFPAAIEDCYDALLWLYQHTQMLGVRSDQLFLGGGSAGGGLAVALAMMTRDRGKVNIAFQMPLYPMLDNTMSTESMKDNNCIGWNEAKNRVGWRMYLGENFQSPEVSKYASPSRETDYTNLPPAFTYVGSCDPFCDETQDYIQNLKKVGIEAECTVYQGGYHAFEMNSPQAKISIKARNNFRQAFQHAIKTYFVPQKEEANKNESYC